MGSKADITIISLGVIFLAIPSIVLLILSLYTFHIREKELDYTCQTGEKIDGWNVLDGTIDRITSIP